jgi:hypothetical protein
MSNAARDGAAQAPHHENAAYRAVIADLVGLVEHVQNSLRLIERMIDGETPESSTNIIVLDDVSPRYMRAVAALQACDVSLGIALRSLLDPDESAASSTKLPAFSATGT